MKLKVLVIALGMAGVAGPAMAAKAPAQKQEFKALKAEMAAARTEMGIPASSGASAKSSGPSAADVGDADSFGRYAKYIGLMSGGAITLTDDCTPDPSAPPGPNDQCVVLNPQPALTTFSFPNIAQMTIPGKSSNSLFCHWQTPISVTQWQNLTAGNIPNARIIYTPSYTFTNPVLNDPSIIDPSTGLPLGGSITVGLAGIRHHMTLEPGDIKLERDSETRVCIAGALSRQALLSYGLNDAQVTKFFANDTVVTMSVSGQAQGVVFSSLIVGTRWMGD
jgi:hypothetical protein